jgi:hypothetical protein
VIDNNLITKPFSSKDRVACRWVNMKLNCNAEISIGDFRAVTATPLSARAGRKFWKKEKAFAQSHRSVSNRLKFAHCALALSDVLNRAVLRCADSTAYGRQGGGNRTSVSRLMSPRTKCSPVEELRRPHPLGVLWHLMSTAAASCFSAALLLATHRR